jgi:hypothetical protein
LTEMIVMERVKEGVIPPLWSKYKYLQI